MASLSEERVYALLLSDPAGARQLGAKATRTWARRIASRQMLAVHSTLDPGDEVGWVARDSLHALTYFVASPHTGTDPTTGLRRNDLNIVIEQAREQWPGVTWAVVLPWNGRSRRVARRYLRGGVLGVLFWL